MQDLHSTQHDPHAVGFSAFLGHASLQTTSIFVRAERQRMLGVAAQYYS